MKMMKEYYENKTIKFELIKNMVGREVSFLGENLKVRGIKAHMVKFLDLNFKNFKFFDRELNIYYSLAKLKDMPMFTYNMQVRKKQMQNFNIEFDNYVVGYDFAMDFDAHEEGGFYQAFQDVKKIVKLFDKWEIPYSVRFSGSGFHLVIEDQFLPKMKDFMMAFQGFAQYLKVIFDLKSLDESIYDIRRIWKCPYSIDFKTGNVCLPLSKEQFEHFTLGMVKPQSVLRYNLFNRGNLNREGSLENVIKLFDEYFADVEGYK